MIVEKMTDLRFNLFKRRDGMGVPTLVATLIFSLVASSALAQTTRSSPTDPSAPPLSRSISPATGFTEADAKSRIEARGYSNVGELHKDAFGIWRNRDEERQNLYAQSGR
jgi:hypothetical protein